MTGDLWYPHLYESNQGAGTGYPPACLVTPPGNPSGRWDYGACVTPPAILPNGGPADPSYYFLPTPSAVPEFFADTAMVNGAPYPVLNVTDQTFRFRILNGSQARFWHLNLYQEDPSNPGEPKTSVYNPPIIVKGLPGPIMYQIGTEGGFLPAVAVHDNTTPCPKNLNPITGDPAGNMANPDGPFNLLLAPAERADVLIDFSGVISFPTSFILYNDAPAPFPGGDPRNDYYTGDPDFTDPSKNTYGLSGGAPSTVGGSGPNTRTIMKIVVVGHSASGITITPAFLAALNTALNNNFFGGNPVPPQQDLPLDPKGLIPKNKTLNEDFDMFGRLLQRGGTDQSFTNNQGQITYGQGYLDSITETVAAGDTQVWDFYNTTGDTHPWHFHLVNVQVIGRAPYATIFNAPTLFSPPDPNELGWKDTVRMNPGEVTRVIMKFTLPNLPTAAMQNAVSPRTGGHEYVHHCHILEHEEHDMMRVLKVT